MCNVDRLMFQGGKLFWDLTGEFAGFLEKEFLLILLRSFAVLKKAIQSFRPFDFAQGCTPAFGRVEAPLRGALFRCPFDCAQDKL